MNAPLSTGGQSNSNDRTGVSRVAHRALGLVLILVVGINVLNAGSRYLFSWSPAGADELMVYLLIAVIMAGSVISLRRRRHIGVSILISLAGETWQRWLYRLHDVLALFVCATLALASWQFVGRIADIGIRSMSLGIPLWIPHSVVFIGLAGMSLVALHAVFLRNDRK